jgi:hypothetical protein
VAVARDFAWAGLIAVAAWALPAAAVHRCPQVLLNFGPNDTSYIRGFREGWEREGRTRFHWTSPSAAVTLPLRVQGDGFRLRMRVRRHFLEPAHVRLSVEGRTVAAFDLKADEKVAYPIVEVALPRLEGRAPFALGIEAPSSNPRPLGMAIDWLSLQRAGAEGRVLLLTGTRLRIVLAALVTFLALRAGGVCGWWALAPALAAVIAAALGGFADPLALERVLREGLGVYGATALVALALVRWPRMRAALGAADGPWPGALVGLVLVALAIRLVWLLHPQFYYPDVKVHSLFAWQLARRGLGAFLRDFTLNQYRYSLGLQMENGHWYAFPYPPAFYLLTWPLVRLFGYAPEVAVSVLAAAVNALEPLLVFGIARALGLAAGVSLGAAAVVPVLPLFLARLTLAYFPALVGHAFDTLVILYLLRHLADLSRPRVLLSLAVLLSAALLTYTQSMLNFAILLGVFLLLDVFSARDPDSRRRQAALAAAGVLAGALSLAIFYGRYIPVFLDMRRGIPQPEEQVLIEKQSHAPSTEEETAAPEPDDPYSGPTFDPVRGLRKAAARLVIFYGPFALAVAAGVALLIAGLRGAAARLVGAWAATYVLLNLGSGGLPGPNLIRYNKDLEIVVPLCCVALAMVGLWLWRRARWMAAVYAAALWAFGVWRAVGYLTEKFVFER